MKITFAIGSRANWGSVRAVVERLRQEHHVTAFCYGTAILERYGNVSAQVEEVCPVVRYVTHIEGGTPEAAGESAAKALSAATSELTRNKPDAVWVVGDRYEVGPVAYAAHVLGIKVFHSMGGEVSGTIDDKIRHSITQLADYHFVATDKAAQRVQDMIGGPGRVYVTGCPRIDIAKRVKESNVWINGQLAHHSGETGHYALDRPYIVVMFHPDVDHWQEAGAQMKAVLDGVDAAWDGDVHLFWPNSDPGCEAIVQAVRDRKRPYITHRSLPDEAYYALLAGARCAVGNSSSFIREGSFLGVPVVLVGGRQAGREMLEVVRHVQTQHVHCCLRNEIAFAIEDDRPEPSTLYGSGDAAEKIAAVLRGAT